MGSGSWATTHQNRAKACLLESLDETRVPTQVAKQGLDDEMRRVGALFDDLLDPLKRHIVIAQRGMDHHKMERRNVFAVLTVSEVQITLSACMLAS